MHVCHERGERVVSGEGMAADEHLVGDDPERVLIRCRTRGLSARRALRRDVLGGPHERARLRHPRTRADDLREAEVGEHRRAIV